MKEEDGISMEQLGSQQFGASRLTGGWPTALRIVTSAKASETVGAPASSALRHHGVSRQDWRGQEQNGADGGQFEKVATDSAAAPASATDIFLFGHRAGHLLETTAGIRSRDYVNGARDFASVSGMSEVDDSAGTSQNLTSVGRRSDFSSVWVDRQSDESGNLDLNSPLREEAEAALHVQPEGLETVLNLPSVGDVEEVIYEDWGYPLEDAWMYARRTTRSRAAVEQDSWKFSQESMSGVPTQQDASRSSQEPEPKIIAKSRVMGSSVPLKTADSLVLSSPAIQPIPSMSGGIDPEDNAEPPATDSILRASYSQRGDENSGTSTLILHLGDEQPCLSPQCTESQDGRTQPYIPSENTDSTPFDTKFSMIFESNVGSQNVHDSSNTYREDTIFVGPHSRKSTPSVKLHDKSPNPNWLLYSKQTGSTPKWQNANSSFKSEQHQKNLIVASQSNGAFGETDDATHGGIRHEGNDAEEIGQPSNAIQLHSESISEPSYLLQNLGIEDGKVPEALWAKCGERWEPGIRCSPDDTPTVTLKSKPHYSKRRYFLIFFPAGGHWSWVDVTHTCPISHRPLPLNGNGTHEGEREAVKDLSLPRRRILLRLGAEMLDISDRLHIKAVTDASRDVNVWKRFAEDAAHATNYSQLGSLLVRLHLAIGQPYIKLSWTIRRYQNWRAECFKASTARIVDKLTKELINAVHWEVVSRFWNEPEQPELDPAWTNWKGDAFDEVLDEKNEMVGNGERCDEDEGSRSVPALPSDYTPPERGSIRSGAKRFKQQARARRTAGSPFPDVGHPPQQNECRVLALPQTLPNEAGEGLSFPLDQCAVDISPQPQDKDRRLVSDSVARDSGLCTAYLKVKGRRCIRRANPGIRYCGKHKYITSSGDGAKDLSPTLGQAWESGLCSAYLKLDYTRCQGRTVGDSVFCELHFSLPRIQNLNDEGENVLISSALSDPRCRGITNKGCQCTHKPKGNSPFCEKHILQESNWWRERHGLVAVSEDFSHKRQRLIQEKSRMESPEVSPSPALPYTRSDQGYAFRVESGENGLVNRHNTTTPSSEMLSSAIPRKRKFFAPGVSSEVSSAQEGIGRESPGNKQDLRPRCIGRIAKDESQCSFKARAGNHYLCTKHLVTAENHMSARGLHPGPNPQRDAVALMEKYMKAALDVPAGEEGAQKRSELVRWARCQASQDVYCAEKFLTVITEEVAWLQKMLSEAQRRDSELNSQVLVPPEDRSMVEFYPREVAASGDDRGVYSGSTLMWPSLVEGRLGHVGRRESERPADRVTLEFDIRVTTNFDAAEPLRLLEYVKESERSDPARCGLCDLIFVAKGNLCTHWKDCHKKEASRLVKGYICRSCRSFLYSRKHLVEKHWKKRHSFEAQVPKSEQWSAVCAACNSAFEVYEDVLEHVCAEHPDMLTGDGLKELSVLGRVDIPVEIAMGEDLECKDCQAKFDSHWDCFHHFRNTHKSAGVQVENTSDRSMEEPTLAGKSIPHGGTTLLVTDQLHSQSESQLIRCHLCGEKFSFAHIVCKAVAGFNDMEFGGGRSVHSASGCGTLLLKSEPANKISLAQKPAGGTPNKRKSFKQSEEKEKVGPKEDSSKTMNGEKGTLLMKMKTAVHTAQVRNIKLSKRGEGSALRPRKALYSLTKGGQIIQDYDATIIADDNDLLDIAQSACCQKKLLVILGQRYGAVSPEKLCKRTMEVCNASNVRLEWFPGGCRCCVSSQVVESRNSLGVSGVCDRKISVGLDVSSLSLRGIDHIEKHDTVTQQRVKPDRSESNAMASKGGHNSSPVLSKFDAVIVTMDLSGGQEPVPVACLVDKDVLAYLEKMKLPILSPEDSFTYITQRVLDPSLGLDPENYKVGCSCLGSQCAPESCDHVHIFDNDNIDALDIFGREMKGRFPYDGNGSIILEEGYLVYECNSSCNCDKSCANRVLQKGVNVRLEVFKTSQKGWAVRAAQNIPRGTFVCEYLGEVLRDQDANKRGETYDKVGCSYLYDIDAHLDVSGKVGRAKPFVIDATKHGNVARFINHSCAPNLINYQILVDSMDYQLAHIGLFASRDIKIGEELAYDYRYRLLPGRGCPCHCGALNCRGRLY